MKYRYGDVFINHNDSSKKIIKYENDEYSAPIPIYYITVSTKYSSLKIDTEAFNIFHITDIFSKALKDGYSVKEPKSVFIVFPYIIIHPNEFLREDKRKFYLFKDKLYAHAFCSHKEKINLDFRIVRKQNDENINLPNNSHSILSIEDMDLIYKKLNDLYKEYKQHKIKKSELTVLTYEKLTSNFFHKDQYFIIGSENYFDVRTWEGYIKLLNWEESNKTYYKQYVCHWMSRQTVKLANLTYIFDEPIIEDIDPYNIKYASSVKDRRFNSWKKRRAKLRIINNNGKT